MFEELNLWTHIFALFPIVVCIIDLETWKLRSWKLSRKVWVRIELLSFIVIATGISIWYHADSNKVSTIMDEIFSSTLMLSALLVYIDQIHWMYMIPVFILLVSLVVWSVVTEMDYNPYMYLVILLGLMGYGFAFAHQLKHHTMAQMWFFLMTTSALFAGVSFFWKETHFLWHTAAFMALGFAIQGVEMQPEKSYEENSDFEEDSEEDSYKELDPRAAGLVALMRF